MASGGARKGAGRKRGVPNKATAKVRAAAAKSGPMPVDILLDVARYHFARSLELRRKRGAERLVVENEIRGEHAMAVAAADKAAPYYHPRLATLQSNVNLTGRLTLEQLVEASMPAPANDDLKLIEAPSVEEKDAVS